MHGYTLGTGTSQTLGYASINLKEILQNFYVERARRLEETQRKLAEVGDQVVGGLEDLLVKEINDPIYLDKDVLVNVSEEKPEKAKIELQIVKAVEEIQKSKPEIVNINAR